MAKKNDPLWIEHMHMNKGSLTRKAKRAKMTPAKFAEAHMKGNDPSAKQSRLRRTLVSLNRGRSR